MLKSYYDCTWRDNNYIDAAAVLTVFSEMICSDVIYDDGNPGPNYSFDGGRGNYLGRAGGGGGEVNTAPPVVNLPGEGHSKINPKQYINCFVEIPSVMTGAKRPAFHPNWNDPGLPLRTFRSSTCHLGNPTPGIPSSSRLGNGLICHRAAQAVALTF